MAPVRKMSDVWEKIIDRKPSNIGVMQWKQSYEGVRLALLYVGLVLITTKDEFDSIEIPIRESNGQQCFGHRKVIVSRDGTVSEPIRIDDLLTGNSKLLTKHEREKIYDNQRVGRIEVQVKGLTINNNAECTAIEKLHALLRLNLVLDSSYLYEFRLGDIAYSLKNSDDWLADQIKSCVLGKRNRYQFNMTVENMLAYLEKGLSLTCIGMTAYGNIDIVWVFYGEYAITMLQKFDGSQQFDPNFCLQRISSNKFTNEVHKSEFKFDVASEDEIERLVNRKVEIVKHATKYSLEYLNHDISQISGEQHRQENISFLKTRNACQTIGINVTKFQEDNYGQVDFRVQNARIQDKAHNDDKFHMRNKGGYPYNPDVIDVFQVSNLKTGIVFAIPMRIINNDVITSTFSEIELMRERVLLSKKFKTKYQAYACNLNVKKDIQKYVRVCEDATQIPIISDENFYKNILNNNKDKFFRRDKKLQS